MSLEKALDTIEELIKNNDVVLFMKGTKHFPQCGFSATVVNILEKLDVAFQDVNVLEDEYLRQAIKEFTTWPTIPQLYVRGNFIGGCDIVSEMMEDGELKELLCPIQSHQE